MDDFRVDTVKTSECMVSARKSDVQSHYGVVRLCFMNCNEVFESWHIVARGGNVTGGNFGKVTFIASVLFQVCVVGPPQASLSIFNIT